MKKNRVVPMWLSIVLLASLALGIVLNIITISDGWNIALKVVDIIACIIALFYCLKGYSKNAAIYFKIFCIVYCISLAIPIFLVAGIYQAGDIRSICTLTLRLVTFACSGIFAVASDLGKKKSYILATIMLIFTLATMLTVKDMTTGFIFGVIGKNTLAVIFFIMIYAKYADKDNRNTK